MSRFLCKALLLLALTNFFVVQNGCAQWQMMSNGLNGGNVLSLLDYNDLIFAGTNGAGIFISSDQGATWTSASKGLPQQPNVKSLVNIGTTIFAGLFYGSVYKSTDNGANWVSVPAIANKQIEYMFVSGSKLFVSTANNELFVSNDNGNTWTQITNGLPSNGRINIVITNGTSLFAGLNYHGLYRSDDDGSSWVNVAAIPSDVNVASLAINGNNIVAGVNNNGIYYSNDSGTTWNLLGGITNEIIYSLSYIGSTLYAGTFNSGMKKSVNNGSSWTDIDLGRVNSVNKIQLIGNNIFAATSDGMYRSIDAGISWNPSNTNLKGIVVNSLAVSGTKVLIGTDFSNGLFISSDEASSWDPVFLPKSSTNSIVSSVEIYGDTLMGMQSGQIKISENSGASWSNYYSSNNFSVLINKGNVFRADGDGLYIYQKNSNGWIPAPGVASNLWFGSLTKLGNTTFAATYFGLGIIRSNDFGTTWEKINNGLESDDPNIIGLYAMKTKVLARTNTNKLYVTSDLGNNWTQKQNTPLPLDLVFFNGYGFMTSYNGVYVSMNEGETWVITENLLPKEVSPLSIGANENTLFVGTSQGVWTLPLSSFYPQISSFTPASGAIGSSVTIQGSNFTTPEFVKVKFNGVSASISATTPNSIIVTVPPGASTGKISVEVNGQIAYSTEDYCVIPEKPTITADLSNPSNPTLTSSSAVSNKWFYNEAEIVGATSTSLSITNAGSYAVQVVLSGCSSPKSDAYCFNIAKPTITTDFSDQSKPVLTSSSTTGNQWYLNEVAIDGATAKTLVAASSGSYTVRTFLFNCLSPFSDPVPVIVTGDIGNSLGSKELQVFPSPVINELTIYFTKNDFRPSTFYVHDILGRQIKQINGSSEEVTTTQVGEFPSGIYLISTINDGKLYRTRFVKK